MQGLRCGGGVGPLGCGGAGGSISSPLGLVERALGRCTPREARACALGRDGGRSKWHARHQLAQKVKELVRFNTFASVVPC